MTTAATASSACHTTWCTASLLPPRASVPRQRCVAMAVWLCGRVAVAHRITASAGIVWYHSANTHMWNCKTSCRPWRWISVEICLRRTNHPRPRERAREKAEAASDRTRVRNETRSEAGEPSELEPVQAMHNVTKVVRGCGGCGVFSQPQGQGTCLLLRHGLLTASDEGEAVW